MHIESVPWNNKMVTVYWEDKWHWIVALDIGGRFEFAVDSGLPGKEVNPGTTFDGGGVSF